MYLRIREGAPLTHATLALVMVLARLGGRALCVRYDVRRPKWGTFMDAAQQTSRALAQGRHAAEQTSAALVPECQKRADQHGPCARMPKESGSARDQHGLCCKDAKRERISTISTALLQACQKRAE